MTDTAHDSALRDTGGRLLVESWSTSQQTLERLRDALHRLELPDPPPAMSPTTCHVPLPPLAVAAAAQQVPPRRHARARHRRRREPVRDRLLRKRTAVLLVVPAACAVPLVPPLVR
ncbi:hypothetical protein ABZ502_16895 [Streptomyces abikoensis]|uniref:hypothetical protein n=1 Tax=Streptomyces abikoensis TaxID=97398 RepID=UPI0033C173CA